MADFGKNRFRPLFGRLCLLSSHGTQEGGSNLHVGSGGRVPVRTKPGVGGDMYAKEKSGLFLHYNARPCSPGLVLQWQAAKGHPKQAEKADEKEQEMCRRASRPPPSPRFVVGALLSLVPRVLSAPQGACHSQRAEGDAHVSRHRDWRRVVGWLRNNKSQRSVWGVGNDPIFLPHRRGCEAGSGLGYLGRDDHQGASVDGRVARKKKTRRRCKGAFVEKTHLAAEYSGCRGLLSIILMVGEYPYCTRSGTWRGLTRRFYAREHGTNRHQK